MLNHTEALKKVEDYIINLTLINTCKDNRFTSK